jgi:Carboxypeptidase regulatory-like domain/FG-GAP-like repeat
MIHPRLSAVAVLFGLVMVASMPAAAQGFISGTVTSTATGLPVAHATVQALDGAGQLLAEAETAANGVYTVGNVPVGAFYVRALAFESGLVSEVFDNVTCAWICDVSAGTPVAVTQGGTTGNINFALSPGGRITGTVTNTTTGLPQFVFVEVFTSTGSPIGHSVSSDSLGVYTTMALPAGSYFVRTSGAFVSGLIDEVFDNMACPSMICDYTAGTPVVVAPPANRTNIDFALTPGGRIAGTVTNATTGLPVPNMVMNLYSSTGTLVASAGTNAQGLYTSLGVLPTGSYFVRTKAPVAAALVDELFDNIPCPGGICTAFLASGSPVSVTAGATTGSIDFALTPQKRVAAPSDFDGDGKSDIAVFRPSDGGWYVLKSSSGFTTSSLDRFGLPGHIPVPGDYNGDGTIDRAVFQPATATWFVQNLLQIQFGQPGDIPVPADYNGDGTTDLAVYRPSTGAWSVRNQFTVQIGLPGDIPVAGDYDGDGIPEVAVYRPSTGTWYIWNRAPVQWGLPGDIPVPGDYGASTGTDIAVFRPSTGTWYLFPPAHFAGSVWQWGLPGDVPMPGDYDGNGLTDMAVYRPSTGGWYVRNQLVRQWGLPGDIPVPRPAGDARPGPSARPADVDGDGMSDMTIFRPSTGVWYSLLSSTNFNTTTSRLFGQNGDIKVPGDYDGDRKTDQAVYRPSTGTWYWLSSSNGVVRSVHWGASTDVPLPADYDGDGRTDLGVFNPSTREWLVSLSSLDYTTWVSATWGIAGDTPLAADFDGDGRADLCVFRPSTGEWFVRLTTTAFGASIVRQWGVTGDVPVVADFDGDGRADFTIFRPSTGEWLGVDALTGSPVISTAWGLSGDTPVPHDFDGDGRADAAIFRPATGEWFVRSSVNGTAIYRPFGLPGDSPALRTDTRPIPREDN